MSWSGVRSALGAGALMIGAMAARPLLGQEIIPGGNRFDWLTVVVLVYPDSLAGVGLFVDILHEKAKSLRVGLDPQQAKQWETESESVLEAEAPSENDTSSALAGPTLNQGDRFRMALGRLRKKGAWSQQVRWYLEEQDRSDPLVVEMSLGQAHDLLGAIGVAAGLSSRDSTYHACGRHRDLSQDPVRCPRVASAIHPRYPSDLLAAGLEGEALVKFTVMPDGRADPASIVVLWATDSAFGQSTMDAMAATKFRPAQEDGVAIPCVVTQSVRFKMRDH